MGVGGNFWDILKPYARTDGFDFLRNKRVAIDLSYWVVQHETAIKVHTRNPHIRLTFFRTINLFSKFGAFPVFVADGTPSPLKARARIMRFLQASGIDPSPLPVADRAAVDRNRMFSKCVQECVELLELLGMPVLKASGEAEGLCAQQNRESRVDACITSDSDAFLFGAKCIIKRLKPNSQEPFEFYQMADIEAGLGLERNHLIAVALLVGNDHDMKGVQGVGLETALSFVKLFREDEVLDRLCEIGSRSGLTLQGRMTYGGDFRDSDDNTTKTRFAHCSLCGHPGSKRAHLKDSCERCGSRTSKGCVKKPTGFRCDCSSCDLDKKEKERKKNEAWKTRVCQKIASEPNFPNHAIIQMYLSGNHHGFADAEPFISWKNPNTEMLVDYVSYKLNWEPSYARQKLVPLLSTVFLRKIASNQETNSLYGRYETSNRDTDLSSGQYKASNQEPDFLYGQYEFDFIQRTKVRFGHTFYVVVWKRSAPRIIDSVDILPAEEPEIQEDHMESVNVFDLPDVTDVCVGNGCLTTDENMDLVKAAYPEKVDQYMQRKESNEAKSRKKASSKSVSTPESSRSPTSGSVQLNITQFYRASKGDPMESLPDNGSSTGKRNVASGKLSKSTRRRLLLG